MTNKIEVFKRNSYNHDDSSKVFLLAILCPFILAFFASYIAQTIAGNWGFKPEDVTSNIWFNLVTTILLVGVYVGIWLVYNKLKGIRFSAVGFKPKMKWHTYLILLVVAVVVIFGCQYLVQAFEYSIEGIGYPIDESFGAVEPNSVGTYIYCVFALAIVPAFCEELLFRGVIFNGLREKFPSVVAVILSAVFFALAHQNLQQMIFPMIFGSVLAIIVLRTGSLFASMFVHFVNNFIVVTMRYVTNLTGFTFEIGNTWWFYLIAIATATIAFGVCFIIDRFYFKHKIQQPINATKTKMSKYFFIALGVGVFMFLLNVALTVLNTSANA